MSGGPRILLGFDYGSRRIGVAIGDTLTGLARPLPAIVNDRGINWPSINLALSTWQPAACVVGLPLTMDGAEQPMSKLARAFAQELQRRSGLPAHLCDERMSSLSADSELRQARSAARAGGARRRQPRPGESDGVAARLILEQWMASSAAAA